MRTASLSSIVGCLKTGALAGVPLLLFGEACLVSAAGSGDDPDPTSIVEVVMYGVDDDTHELLRYSFRTNEYIVLGEIRDDEGEILEEVEALGFIPSGPHKGLYGAANYGNNRESRLLKFNVFDAGVTVYPVPIGFGNVEGMVSSRDPESGEWKLYATPVRRRPGRRERSGKLGRQRQRHPQGPDLPHPARESRQRPHDPGGRAGAVGPPRPRLHAGLLRR